MTLKLYIHPENPQARLIRQAAEVIRNGGVIVYPTDSAYAFGTAVGNKAGMDRMVSLRRLPNSHNFAIICRDLSELGTYAKVDNTAYRMLKNNTPGAYTFILSATTQVPKRLLSKRKTIGLRVPEHNICQALLEELDAPMLTSTLILPGDEDPLIDPDDIRERLEGQVDAIIDGGWGDIEPTTVVDLGDGVPNVVRAGKGDPSPFEY